MRSRDAFARKLEQAGFNEKEYADYVRQDLSGAKFLMRKSSETPTVSDAEVTDFYQKSPHRFTKPEAMRARHILLRVASGASAEERSAARTRIDALQAELKAGADVSELARRHSGDNSALNGGDLGEVPRGRMVKAFEDALYTLKPGEQSDVVQSGFGLHLIRCDEAVPAVTQPLAEVPDSIRARLLAEKRTTLAREMVAALRASARTEILVKLD
jgi:peptidyl-prolyl cis-trans isomerase C